MMRNEGSMVPNAVIMLPRIPRSRYPIKMDILTEKGGEGRRISDDRLYSDRDRQCP